MANHLSDDDWLDLLDLSAIADPGDKLAECAYFLALASQETCREHFRWLISAFFNAAYSYFETSALLAYAAFCDPDTGEPIEDEDALVLLRQYVKVSRSEKKPNFVKTSGLHPVTQQLYELRKASTHHFPLSIMITGQSLPRDFHFGNVIGGGTPALEFCNSAMTLIHGLQKELDKKL